MFVSFILHVGQLLTKTLVYSKNTVLLIGNLIELVLLWDNRSDVCRDHKKKKFHYVEITRKQLSLC